MSKLPAALAASILLGAAGCDTKPAVETGREAVKDAVSQSLNQRDAIKDSLQQSEDKQKAAREEAEKEFK